MASMPSAIKIASHLMYMILIKNLSNCLYILIDRFFHVHPVYLELFPALKDLDPDEVNDSLFVRAHSLTVLHSMMSMVDNIDDKRRLQAILGRTARIHYGFGIRFVHFEVRYKCHIYV